MTEQDKPVHKPAPSKDKKSRDPIYITIIILLLIGAGLMFMEMQNQKGKLDECTSINKELGEKNSILNSAVQDLESNPEDFLKDLSILLEDYDTMIAISSHLKGKNRSLMDSLEAKRNLIKQLEDEVKAGKWRGAQLRKKEEELEVLRGVLQTYVRRIDSLTIQNQELSKRLKGAQEQLDQADKTITNYEVKTNRMEETIKEGMVLKAAGAVATGIRLTRGGDQRETTRAKRCNQVKTCFTVMENSIAKPGVKSLYLRVIDPGGNVLGSSTFKGADGSSVVYSSGREIDYQNRDLDVCIYHVFAETPPADGTYKIEIWAEGHKIGSANFDLK